MKLRTGPLSLGAALDDQIYAKKAKAYGKYMSEPVRRLLTYVEPIYNKCDGAHKLRHVINVFSQAMAIASTVSKIEDPSIIESIQVAAITHDIGLAFTGRKDHHNASAIWVRDHSTALSEMFPLADIHLVIAAVVEHRASYRGDYTSIVSEVVSAADRQTSFDDPLDLYLRSYEVATGSMRLGHLNAINHAFAHVKEKYGRGGYAYRNPTYMNTYRVAIEYRWDVMDTITCDDVTAYIDKALEANRLKTIFDQQGVTLS